MTPGWISVVISLGSVAIGAAATLLGARISGRNEARRTAVQIEAEAQRARQQDETTAREQVRVWRQGVAADYARHFLGAWVATKQAVDSLGLGDPVEGKTRADADWLVNELPTFLGPVLLMFGKDIEAAADAALVKLQDALESQHHARADDARSSLDDARLLRAQYDDLIRAQLGTM